MAKAYVCLYDFARQIEDDQKYLDEARAKRSKNLKDTVSAGSEILKSEFREIETKFRECESIKKRLQNSSLEDDSRHDLESKQKLTQNEYNLSQVQYKKKLTNFFKEDDNSLDTIMTCLSDFERFTQKTMDNIKSCLEKLQNIQIDRVHRPVFETELVSHLQDSSLEVAAPVKQVVDFIKAKPESLKIEGLFRVQGSIARVQELRARFDEENTFHIPHKTDIHTVCTFLKTYLRSLPDPLFDKDLTYDIKSHFDLRGRKSWTPEKISSFGDASKRENLRKIIEKSWGDKNETKLTIKELMMFLNNVSRHSEDNKMTVENLGIVFAPTILYQDQEMPFVHRSLTEAVEFMIKDPEYLFESIKPSYIERSVDVKPKRAPPPKPKVKKKIEEARLSSDTSTSSRRGSRDSLDVNSSTVSDFNVDDRPNIGLPKRSKRVAPRKQAPTIPKSASELVVQDAGKPPIDPNREVLLQIKTPETKRPPEKQFSNSDE